MQSRELLMAKRRKVVESYIDGGGRRRQALGTRLARRCCVRHTGSRFVEERWGRRCRTTGLGEGTGGDRGAGIATRSASACSVHGFLSVAFGRGRRGVGAGAGAGAGASVSAGAGAGGRARTGARGGRACLALERGSGGARGGRAGGGEEGL